MSQQTTIRKLAALVNTPVEKLLEQLAEAGMKFSSPDQVVTSTEKVKLLGFLRRTHGKSEKAAEEAVSPKKITLNRSRKQELTVGGGKNRQTVDVVVRKKVTVVPPTGKGDGVDPASGLSREEAERAEILRKLEESRQRNLSEQQRLAEEDKRRAEEAAERKRQAEAEAERLRKEAAAAAAVVTGDDDAPRRAARRTATASRPSRPPPHAMTAAPPTRARRSVGRMRWSPGSRTTRAPRVSPASCICRRPTAPVAAPHVAGRSRAAMSSSRAAARAARTASSVRPHRSCARSPWAKRSPWPTSRRSSR